MGVVVRGNRALARKFRELSSTQGVQRITSPAVEKGARRIFDIARRRGFGFRDRTGLLRRSLRLEQARRRTGRFRTGWQLVASTRYARWVEYRPRTRDRRPGPPYWLGLAARLGERRASREIREAIRQNVISAWRRR